MFAQRLRALTKKEALQIVRDPSSIVIAFILPLTLLFLFGYGLSLDARGIRLGIALETPISSPASPPRARSFCPG